MIARADTPVGLVVGMRLNSTPGQAPRALPRPGEPVQAASELDGIAERNHWIG